MCFRWNHPSANCLRVLAVHFKYLNIGTNRDSKATLNKNGRAAIHWIFEHAPLPPNVLLQLPRVTVDRIMGLRHGTQRLNELFRCTLGKRVGRGVVATVAQQDDYMKRIRANGGARTALRPEGIVILGQFRSHARIALALGAPISAAGESVAVRLVQTDSDAPGAASIEGKYWRVAQTGDPVFTAPNLPPV